jgi:hypothetical protein
MTERKKFLLLNPEHTIMPMRTPKKRKYKQQEEANKRKEVKGKKNKLNRRRQKLVNVTGRK